ncbi:signal peptide peptidase SppA [bacterium]|nr:signal peptide peptidase SppA [bacterium]
MLNKRDIVLGLFILMFFLGFVLIVTIMLSSMSADGFRVAQKRVAVIEIVGPIISPASVVNKLERYMKNNNIPAVVIRLDTPGGGVAASQEIYETIIKARYAGKKIVASMGSVAASGGYYIAAACDTVVANPGTITGSIGVIVNFADFSDLYKKVGIDFPVRKSGKYKDIGSSARKMTDEEKALIDSVIMDTYDQFVTAVSEGRDIDAETVRSFADGRVFTGRQAKERGLVDVMGTYQDAIDIAGTMVGLGVNPPVLKETRTFWEDMLLHGITRLQWLKFEQGEPHLLYLM